MADEVARKDSLWTGVPGESVFNKPFLTFPGHNELMDLFQKAEGANDHRLLAILTALIIENRCDKLLSAFLPRYKRLLDSQNYTFSMKITLLESLAFIPPHITTVAHILRNIRNEFAHNLGKTNFDDLPDKIKRSMRSMRDEVYRGFEAASTEERSLLTVFKNLEFYCTTGLDFYVVNVAYLRKEIEKPQFMQMLANTVATEGEEAIRAIMSQPPVTVEEQGALLIKEYAGGVKEITDNPRDPRSSD
jgi:hypothetical protein